MLFEQVAEWCGDGFGRSVVNLIERLGGYDAAKAEGEEWGFDEFLNEKLLEYRRQHNIFEVGDAMIIPSRGNGIFYFNALFSDSDIAEARHATDAEIEAGKRLEVS
jgi:hypothetical protein